MMRTTRRQFIKTAGALAGFHVLPSGLLAKAPNSRVCTAQIGLGSRGKGDLSRVGGNSRTEVIGVCDVDRRQYDGKIKRLYPNAGFYQDYRDMLLDLGDKVDAIFDPSKTLTANFDYAAHLTEMLLLGTVAGRFPNQRLTWDAKAMKVTNLEAANQYVSHAYRTDY